MFVDLGLTPSIEPPGLKDPLAGLEVIPVDVKKLLERAETSGATATTSCLEKGDKVG